MSRSWTRAGRMVGAGMLVVSSVGCAPFDLGSHETLDSWYVGRFEAFDVEEIGFQGLDGGFVGYCVNDVVIRAPVYLAYEALWIAMLPVAVPYYGYRFVARDGSPRPDEPAIGPRDGSGPEGAVPEGAGISEETAISERSAPREDPEREVSAPSEAGEAAPSDP